MASASPFPMLGVSSGRSRLLDGGRLPSELPFSEGMSIPARRVHIQPFNHCYEHLGMASPQARFRPCSACLWTLRNGFNGLAGCFPCCSWVLPDSPLKPAARAWASNCRHGWLGAAGGPLMGLWLHGFIGLGGRACLWSHRSQIAQPVVHVLYTTASSAGGRGDEARIPSRLR
jgi:hypothetical protein